MVRKFVPSARNKNLKSSQATALLDKLRGHDFAGFRLDKAIGTGATAGVYRAVNDDGVVAAVKIYEAQFADEERLRRELSLHGHDCPHLVRIYGGGRTALEETELRYLVMEFIDGKELAQVRKSKAPIPDAEIRRLLRQLCIACLYLHERDLCHRDIKPQNIKLRSNGELVLLDMGVLRPAGDSDLTQEGRNIATRRYSPPELQHRREDSSRDGLEAVTVYQVGAVLYELIQRTKLFANVPDHPDATLSRAIDTEIPRFVGAESTGADLREATLRCLVKHPAGRPKLNELLALAELVTTPSTSLVAARRARGLRAAAEIGFAERTTEAHLSALSNDKTIAITTAQEAITLANLPEPKFDLTELIGNKLLVATFPQSIEHGLPTLLMLALLFETQPVDSALLIRGCGLYGSTFAPEPKEVPHVFIRRDNKGRVAHEPSTLAMLEVVWELPLDIGTFKAKVATWADQLANIYMSLTEGPFEELVAYRKEVAEARRRGERCAHHPRSVGPLLFNTTKQLPMSPHSWKNR